MIKVGLSALMYPVTMARYFWEALERRKDVEVYAVGPFFGSWIPWNYGINLSEKYVKQPFLPLPREAMNYPVPYEMVANKMPQDLDLFLTIDAGWHFSTRPNAGITALIKTDPHAISKQHYDVPKHYSDMTFGMQYDYLENGEKYLPYAYDATMHYPEEREKIYDACLIGIQYDHRVRLINKLRGRGLNVFSGIGIVFDEYRQKYNESKIAISWSSLKDTPARVFEAFGMGSALVANRTTDLMRWFVDGEHFLGFDTLEEAEAQVMRLIEDDHLRETIADAGHRKVNGHNWNNRVDEILRVAKLIL